MDDKKRSQSAGTDTASELRQVKKSLRVVTVCQIIQALTLCLLGGSIAGLQRLTGQLNIIVTQCSDIIGDFVRTIETLCK